MFGGDFGVAEAEAEAAAEEGPGAEEPEIIGRKEKEEQEESGS